MKKLVERYGKYILATYIIMVVGVILFLLTPLFIRLFNFDSDIVGLLVFLIGLGMFIVGVIIRSILKKS